MRITPRRFAIALLPPLAVGLSAGCEGPAFHPDESILALQEDVIPWEVDDVLLGAEPDPDALRMGEIQKATGAPQVVYSNFSDGTTTLKRGKDNALTNTSAICGTGALGYPKWSGDEARAKKLQNDFAAMTQDFNMVLAAKRPSSGPYSMIMVGPQGNGCSVPGAGGVAPSLDCNNKNPNEICFDFSSKGSLIVMAQEIGHTFGLGHVDVACDFMGASYTKKGCPSNKWAFQDVEDKTIGGSCTGATQNSYQAMKKVLGEWPSGMPHPDPTGDGSTCVDMAAPVVAFTSPTDGAVVGDLELGNAIDVKAEATDDCGKIKNVKIEIPAFGLTAASEAPPYAWTISDVGYQAELEIVLTATDGADKTSQARVKIAVGKAPAPPMPPPGSGEDPMTPPPGGCGCRVGQGPTRAPAGLDPLGLGLLAGAGLLAYRRRRG